MNTNNTFSKTLKGASDDVRNENVFWLVYLSTEPLTILANANFAMKNIDNYFIFPYGRTMCLLMKALYMTLCWIQ